MKTHVDLTDFFRYCGLECPVIITENEGMYPFNDDFRANWLYFTLKGYRSLKCSSMDKAPEKIACIAVGSGAEVIGIKKIFPSTKFIAMTDIDVEVISGAFINVKNAFPYFYDNLQPLTGSLCDPLKQIACPGFDLIHGNVPNLICEDGRDLSSGNDKGTFVKEGAIKEAIPLEYVKWGLGTQYLYLKGAYDFLNKDGSVIAMIGGRFPLEITEKLFSDCNLKLMPEFSVGFKWQTQPEPDYDAYSQLENEYGVSFDFFPFDEALKILKKKNIDNPTPFYSGQQIKSFLKNIKVSATEAFELYKKGIKCGHTVHMFRGVKKE